jgi:hypothetical protein
MLAAIVFAMPLHAQTPGGGAGDELRSVLLESKEKNRGVAIYTNGVTVNAVVVSIDDRYVVARSQQSSRIVIRLDRIDGVSAFF